MKTTFTSQELYVANMISTKFKNLKDSVNQRYKEILDVKVGLKQESDAVDVDNSISYLETMKDKDVLCLRDKTNPYFKYSFLKDNDSFVPFKPFHSAQVVNPLKFTEKFGLEKTIQAGTYALNTKTELIKSLGLDKQSKYEDILELLPSVIKPIIKIEKSSAYMMKRSKINWADALEIAKRNELLSDIYNEVSAAINDGSTYVNIIQINKKLTKLIATAKLYLFNADSNDFDTDLFEITQRENLTYDKEALKKIAIEDSSTKLQECIKFSYELDGELKSIVSLLNEEETGVKTKESFSLMSSIIKTQNDVVNFLLNCPENFWTKQEEDMTYEKYMSNAQKI